MINALIIDFETRSRCDISRGTDIYASDPSTEILCMAAIDTITEDEWLWYPSEGSLPLSLLTAISERNYIAAHNARFDQLIWECIGVADHGFPTLPAEWWYCTSAQCRVNAVPAGLDRAAQFVTGTRLKMAEGKALIRKLSIPNKEGNFNEDPTALRQMGEYCVQDCRATLEVINHLRPMTQQEHQEWLVSERINDRGILIDVELAELATTAATLEAEQMAEELAEMTQGEVTAVSQIQRIKKWALDQLDQAVIDKYLTKEETHKKTGVTSVKTTFDKGARAALKKAAEAGEVTLPEPVMAILTLTEEGNKSSVAKFQRMLALADPDDHRVRGAYVYAGASQTKRFSAKGLQPHNFRRDVLSAEETEEAKHLLREGSIDLLGSVMETLSKLLRPTIIPAEGHLFLVSDWSAIEGRCLPWLSDSVGGERVLDVFRNGEDIYMHTANGMAIPDRQIGKVATLALGYQGGVNAFDTMARAYNVSLPEDRIPDIVRRWRGANPWAVRFWDDLALAAYKAVRYAGTTQVCGRVSYFFAETLCEGTLLCCLPDGSMIHYPRARIDSDTTPWGAPTEVVTFAKAALLPEAKSNRWPRTTLYGGLLAENLTQAVAASLLRDALTRCEKAGLKVALHVHDEIVVESDDIEADIPQLKRIMNTAPEWAATLPLEASVDIHRRYGK